jgi:hypothetical protein
MMLAPRYDGWFAPLIEVAGKEIPMDRSGSYLRRRGHQPSARWALVVVDMGGGYGGPMFEHLSANEVTVKAYKGAEASTRRTADGKHRFTNKRTAAYWMFREGLDPGQPGGSPISLPPDAQLLSDLTAPTFEVTSRGIKAEPKDKVCERIGRSPDRGDAVVMSWHEGERSSTNALDWIENKEHGFRGKKRPQVQTSGHMPLSARGRR